MNTFTATGRLGRDAELRDANGTPVLNFPVATDTGFGDRKATMWINAAIWGKRAQAMSEMLRKGQFVAVTGELSQREYEKDGQPRTSLELRVAEIDLGPKQGDDQDKAPAPSATSGRQHDDEIPF